MEVRCETCKSRAAKRCYRLKARNLTPVYRTFCDKCRVHHGYTVVDPTRIPYSRRTERVGDA